MLTMTQIAGFAGAGLAGAAYVPQISHLVRARCSAGISRLAFAVWLLASVLTTARALAIGAGVFIVLGGIQIVATAFILLCAIRYQGTSCPVHAPGQPAAMAAEGTGNSGNEPGSGPAAGRPGCWPGHARQSRRGTARVRPFPALAFLSGHDPVWPGTGCPGLPRSAKAAACRCGALRRCCQAGPGPAVYRISNEHLRGDDMTASAGAVTAAHQNLGAAMRGKSVEAQAAIVIVSRDPGTREILHRELAKRYGADYQIAACGRPEELAPWMRDLRTAGLPVALAIGGVSARDADGIEVLAAARAVDPMALRVAAVSWGDWDSVRSVFDAVTLGTVDHWVTCPVQVADEEFHRSVTEFLREWAGQRGGGFEAVQVIGERWSARSQELRDLFSRHQIPAGFYDAASGRGLADAGQTSAWPRRSCRWSRSGSGRSSRPWSTPPTCRSPTPSAS